MAHSNYQRERCLAAEMESCWELNPKASIKPYDSEDDPFCPLAVARKFNKMQRREASIGGTQSMIDLRQPRSSRRHPARRPSSSGGRVTAAQTPPIKEVSQNSSTLAPIALPCLAGATLQPKEGGGFKSKRQPPLVRKGLPSSKKIEESFARKIAKEGKLASNKADNINAGSGGGLEQGRTPHPAELRVGDREEFVAKMVRRDDILQDLWLKMHSAEGFTNGQGAGDLAQLLKRYRSASLEVIEDMMRCPELEAVADEQTRKKGEGMKSYRAAVAQDADFADGTDAGAWFGFPTRRNPLFLPPRAAANARIKPLPDIGIDGDNSSDLLARLRDAQDFMLLDKVVLPSRRKPDDNGVGGAPLGMDFSGSAMLGGGGGGSGGGGGGSSRRITMRDKVQVMNRQLAIAQDRICKLEDDLDSLKVGREGDRERAARARAAAAEAGRRKMTQRMYQLRADAAVLEEGLEELDGEISAVRVRLFAERLDVARKRMLKDALTAEILANSKARRRRAKKIKESPKKQSSPTSRPPVTRHGEDGCQRQEDASAAVIQARVRGIRARENAKRTLEAGAITLERQKNRRSSNNREEEAAATRIGAAARGRLARKRAEEREATRQRCSSSSAGSLAARSSIAIEAEPKGGANGVPESGTVVATRVQENEEFAPESPTAAAATASSGPTTAAAAAAAAASVAFDGLAQVEALGVVGVRAFFDSLGLRAYSDRLREGLDGAELARLTRAPDPDAELAAAGVSARLHRVKLLSALGVGVAAGGGAVPPALALGLDEDAARNKRAPVAVMAALHMVRQLRREQGVVADALRRGCGTRASRTPARVGLGWEVVKDDGPTRPGRATGGARETAGAGVAAVSQKDASLVSVVLPELEGALSEQVRLSRQARELLGNYAEEADRDTAGPAASITSDADATTVTPTG